MHWDKRMAFSKSEVLQREHLHLRQVQVCREFTNDANKPKKICEIRPFALHLHCTERSAVQVFAFQNSFCVKRL